MPDFCVPDERDLRFASTGSNFNPPEADRLPPLKVRDLRLELEQKLLFFKGLVMQSDFGMEFESKNNS
ncbi:MAG: hypothetical protein JRD05_09855 [Deltaproteobacteria bacterium]|nr:hypothetical protein [Deltaproteobacteria bacterium]